MSKGLSELDLKDEALPAQTYDDLPQFGGFQEPPQPGPYRFRLPDLTKVWDVFDVPGKGQRVRMIFDNDAPLVIVKAVDPQDLNSTFHTRLSNAERARGKDKAVEASDMDYLLKALGATTRPANNRGYIEAMLPFSGREFGADLTYSFVCSPDRDIYVLDANGQQQKVEGRKGCAAAGSKTGRYYQKDIKKGPDGKYPTQIQCACGAVLRTFANLENFRA